MNFKKRFSDSTAGFQMAPMVDIMFLLLIFFMVATVCAQFETKVGITVPTADAGVRGTREFTELIINLDCERKNSDSTGGNSVCESKIVVNSMPMTPDRLESVLGEIASRYGDAPVIIRADAKAHHEHVVNVLDICRKVDIWNVAFATLPPDKE